MSLYDRTYSLNLNGTRVTGLHIQFDILHTDKGEANSSNIQVFNLSSGSRAKLSEVKDPIIQLDVGYGGDNATVFKGTVRNILTQRDQNEWVTDIDAGDGEAGIRRGIANIRFPPGTKIEDVIESLVSYTGLDIGNLKKSLQNKGLRNAITEFERGATFSGNAHKIVVRLGRALGFRVSVQDETYLATSLAGTVPGEGYVISSGTGLIGSPDIGEKGAVSVTSLMLPLIRPQHKIKLETQQLTGFFRVRSARHIGSLYGSQWTTTLDLKELVT